MTADLLYIVRIEDHGVIGDQSQMLVLLGLKCLLAEEDDRGVMLSNRNDIIW